MRKTGMLVRSLAFCGGLALVAATAFAPSASANPRANLRTDWNNSPDPNAIYGGCGNLGSIGSAYRNKAQLVVEAGVSINGALAITVLDCRPYDGGGGTFVVPCPVGSPYATCIANDNDGNGNAFLFGVLKLNSVTRPSEPYAGCPSGHGTSSKLDLLLRAGEDPRLINGIVTLACGPATGPSAISRVPCPSGPNPYAYCLATGNDGRGNAVKLGVVAANGAADPYGLYGECNDIGTQNGFLPKSSLVTKAGQNLGVVNGIEIIGCGQGGGLGAIARVNCNVVVSQPSYVARFDYCIQGRDEKGNGIAVGVRK